MKVPLWRPHQRDQLDEEIRAHFRMAIEDRVARGESPADAARAVRREFGNVDLVKETTRDSWGWMSLDRIWQDVRYALRTLRRSPAFTAVALLTLALGIGANTAIFSVFDAVLLRRLPYADTDRIVVPVSVNLARGHDRSSVTYGDYVDWRRETDIFERVGLFSSAGADLTGGNQPEHVEVGSVSQDYFDAMGAQPVIGRAFLPEDHQVGRHPVVVLGYGLWQRRFGGARDVVGRTVQLAGVPATIVGVMGPDAAYPPEPALWMPIRVDSSSLDAQRRDNMVWWAIIRLRQGATVEQARARVKTIAARLEREYPESRRNWTADVIPLRRYVVDDRLRVGLYVLMTTVVLVLLIACVNVAGLLLSRVPGRGPELAIRLALGAGRLRLVRQLLVESGVLALVGAAAGLALAWGGIRGLARLLPANLLPAGDLRLDLQVLAVTSFTAVGTALVFGLVPALAASSIHPQAGLREGGRGRSSARAGRLRSPLVVGQLATALVLLVGAGLMLQSFVRLRGADPGVRVERVLGARITLPAARYPQPAQRAVFYSELVTRLASAPGIESAAAVSRLPAGGPGFGLGRVFLAEGAAEPPVGTDHPAMWNVITPGYFSTVGIPILRGRSFTDRDTATSTPVIIISEALARTIFGRQDPIGQRIRSWRDENKYREIIGLAGDVRYFGADDQMRPCVYVPHSQDSWRGMLAVVRTAGDPASAPLTIRRVLSALDHDLALSQIGTLGEFRDESMAESRLQTVLLAGFSALALALAVIGVYGLMAHAVAQRSHEFGVRLALGAAPGQIVRMVLARGAVLTLSGAVAGLVASAFLVRLLKGLLFGVNPGDAPTFAATASLVVLTSFLACWLPARRAARVDPVTALRQE